VVRGDRRRAAAVGVRLLPVHPLAAGPRSLTRRTGRRSSAPRFRWRRGPC
jgi:hypothetical protein